MRAKITLGEKEYEGELSLSKYMGKASETSFDLYPKWEFTYMYKAAYRKPTFIHIWGAGGVEEAGQHGVSVLEPTQLPITQI